RLAVDNNHKIPVWITEMGFNTLEVSDRKAAELLKYQLDLLNYDNDLNFVETVIVFRMIDGANCNFGIFENMYAEENLIDPNAPNKYAVENLKSGYPLKIMGQMFYFYLNPANPSNNPLPMAPEVSDLNNTVSTSNVDIFPNPTTGLVHVVCDEAQTLVRISVKDASGRTVIVNDVDGNFADVDLLLLQKGMYFVEVETNSDKTVKKIILK
ncbi:MAG: T9SS type A sorting domain-containing protein, partial [Paludibacteraceae bacterium]|nr:T9SS type A sorting domain-containing protein [Paludibacteraceae bacterium]